MAAASDILLQIYANYCAIVSGNDHLASREALAMLSKSLDSALESRDAIFPHIYRLMALLDLSADSHKFSLFYDFVFFICRENGQKSISVSRALAAWKLVLNGRFRLLDQWCDFVEKHRRHNISEDTWQQLMAFSRCVNEDLEGYDPKGAWPLLIDDFVEHLYRINLANNSSSQDTCHCSYGMETQADVSEIYSGLKLSPGSKRKSLQGTPKPLEDLTRSTLLIKCKRIRHTFAANKLGYWDSDAAMTADTSFLQTSPCAVEDSLSKGFKGHLSISPSFQFK